jgi:hypothetical protein
MPIVGPIIHSTALDICLASIIASPKLINNGDRLRFGVGKVEVLRVGATFMVK